MWLEAILSHADLTRLVERLLPVELDVDGGTLHLHTPHEVTLVPDRGLRVRCKANVVWPVLGLEVPVALHELAVLLCPEIAAYDGAGRLVFRVEIEHADLAGVPTFIDDTITDRVNAELRAKHVELSWDFARTLSHVFDFPPALALAEALELEVAWGRLRVTGEAIVFAVSFHAEVLREGARAVGSVRAPDGSRRAAPLVLGARTNEGRALAVLGALAVTAAGGLLIGARGLRRHA